MGSKSLASIAFVVMGIYALFSSVGIVHAMLSLLIYSSEFEGRLFVIILAYGFPMLLLVGAGIFLIHQRERLASWIAVPEDDRMPSVERWADFQDLVFAVVGLLLVIATLPSLGALAGSLINLKASEELHEYLPMLRSNLGHYLGTLAELVVGAYLFMNARTVGKWWRTRKRVTAPKASAPPAHLCPACGAPFNPEDYSEASAEKRCSTCRCALPESAFSR